MINRKNISILCLIVIGLSLVRIAVLHAPSPHHPSIEPAPLQISSELRQELVELQVALERGLTQSEMRERSHAITAQLRLHPAGTIPDFRALELSLGALEHFWNRCLDNPSCVRTNGMDLYWLAETGLERNTNAWRAFDFDVSIAAFEARLSRTAAIREGLIHDSVRGYSGSLRSMNEEIINKLKIEDARKVIAFIDDQSAHLNEILDAAIARHDSVNPMYLVKVLKERAYLQSNKLLGK